MAEEIIINVSPAETRVAVVSQGLLQEIFVERVDARNTVGNIYKGRISRILPGMQSAFIDIGSDKAAFAHITDLVYSGAGGEESVVDQKIDRLFSEGQTLAVQIAKEAIGAKGPRVTTHLSLASRCIVYLPGSRGVGISQKIESEEERKRLSDLVSPIINDEAGVILRTAAAGAASEEVLRDLRYLQEKWGNIQDDLAASGTPSLVYEDLPLYIKAIQDLINEETHQIIVDHELTGILLRKFLDERIPGKRQILKVDPGKVLLFDEYQIEDQIRAALNRQVPLKSGGYLVFDQTEAMTTIDVNTGSFTGRKDLEETIYKTNLEAAAMIPRQLRLRGIGGIVIIDFIDMLDEEHKRQVLRTLEKGQQFDRVNWRISDFSDIGLVEMTRKRSKESLLRMMCEPCEACQGRGYVKTTQSVILEIFREIRRRSANLQGSHIMIMATERVIDHLKEIDCGYLERMSHELEFRFSLKSEASCMQEEFDIIIMNG